MNPDLSSQRSNDPNRSYSILDMASMIMPGGASGLSSSVQAGKSLGEKTLEQKLRAEGIATVPLHAVKELFSLNEDGKLEFSIEAKGSQFRLGYVCKNGSYSTGLETQNVITADGGKILNQNLDGRDEYGNPHPEDARYNLKINHDGGISYQLTLENNISAFRMDVDGKAYLFKTDDIRAILSDTKVDKSPSVVAPIPEGEPFTPLQLPVKPLEPNKGPIDLPVMPLGGSAARGAAEAVTLPVMPLPDRSTMDEATPPVKNRSLGSRIDDAIRELKAEKQEHTTMQEPFVVPKANASSPEDKGFDLPLPVKPLDKSKQSSIPVESSPLNISTNAELSDSLSKLISELALHKSRGTKCLNFKLDAGTLNFDDVSISINELGDKVSPEALTAGATLMRLVSSKAVQDQEYIPSLHTNGSEEFLAFVSEGQVTVVDLNSVNEEARWSYDKVAKNPAENSRAWLKKSSSLDEFYLVETSGRVLSFSASGIKDGEIQNPSYRGFNPATAIDEIRIKNSSSWPPTNWISGWVKSMAYDLNDIPFKEIGTIPAPLLPSAYREAAKASQAQEPTGSGYNRR